MIYSIINQKGGVAKTVSTYNIGWELSKKGLKVLIVDLDPQANLTIMAGVEPTTLKETMADVLISYSPICCPRAYCLKICSDI